VRFSVHLGGARPAPAFVVRYGGAVYAYLNVCAHRWIELDWERGKFFDMTGHWLICSTHGATYDPATGRCVGGPCRGDRLTALPVAEQDGEVSLILKDGLDLA
jgi:nitrite reductase/ring-hydroxylating ferredoxin subunit